MERIISTNLGFEDALFPANIRLREGNNMTNEQKSCISMGITFLIILYSLVFPGKKHDKNDQNMGE